MKLEGAVMMEVSLCLRLDLRTHMPFPLSLFAAVDTIKVFGRDAAGTGSIESDLLAFMDVGRTPLSKDDVLARTSNGNGTSVLHLACGVKDLSGKNTRLSLVEHGRDVEALVTPHVSTRKPGEMNLARTHVAIDTVEKTVVPAVVHVKSFGESIERVITHCDDTTNADGDLCRLSLEDFDSERQGEGELFLVVGAVGGAGYHGYTF